MSHLGVSYNGSTTVSKTANTGSIPVTPANDINRHLWCLF